MGGSLFPSLTGALINGIGTNILAGGDTKKGLLMNAALLAGSGGVNGLGSSGAGSALNSATGMSNIVGGSVAPGAFGANITPSAMNFATQVPTSLANTNILNEASKFASPEGFGGTKGIFSGGIGSSVYTPTNLGGGPSTGLINSSIAPTFMENVKSGFSGLSNYTKENPVLSQMALQSAQQMMQQPEMQMAPARDVTRGQIQGADYMSLLNPQQSPVIRPQQISLLG